jgi:hypothetical protein
MFLIFETKFWQEEKGQNVKQVSQNEYKNVAKCDIVVGL